MPGLDSDIITNVDFDLLLHRIQADVRSDFILAPHYIAIFERAAADLSAETMRLLRSGTYSPGLPLTLSIPKKRGFTRPGSILKPVDRVVYHLLADEIASLIEEQLDRNRTFSHILADVSQHHRLFNSSQQSWDQFQTAIRRIADSGGFILKTDIANYFERLPQHHLINLLRASGVSGGIINLLEELLLAFQERDSYGIIQGVYPSDLLGNFYLTEIDSHCDINNIPSARYVDDLYMHFNTYVDAQRGLLSLQEQLRREGLHLNEYKSGIWSADKLIAEETLVDNFFEAARDEVLEEWEYDQLVYGFTANWEEGIEEPTDEELEMQALNRLWESRHEYPHNQDSIDRFCLPIFRAIGDDRAADICMSELVHKPHLTSQYLSYLSRFVPNNQTIANDLSEFIGRDNIYLDSQRIYLIGALMNAQTIDQSVVRNVLQVFQNRSNSQELRALAAIFISKHGNPHKRRAVRLSYESEQSEYVRSAILYSSRYFTIAEQKTCIRAWGSHSLENSLIAMAIRRL